MGSTGEASGNAHSWQGLARSEDGVVFRYKRKENHPVCIKLRWLRDIFLMMQPPLLAVMQGGE